MELYIYITLNYYVILVLCYTKLKLIIFLGGSDRKVFMKKNLAKERMQRLTRSLNVNKEKLKEMYHTDLVSKKASQKFSRSLPSSSSRHTKFCTFFYILHSTEIYVYSICTLVYVYR